MSSRSDTIWRLGAVALFVILMLASAKLYNLGTPLRGSPRTPHALMRRTDRGLALLSHASRPFDQVTFCEPLKGFLPTPVRAGEGGTPIQEAPARPVILCMQGAVDLGAAAMRAQADHLGWDARIKGTRLIAFASDSENFRKVMQAAGAPMAGDTLEPVSVLLQALRLGRPGVEQRDDGWRAAPGDDIQPTLIGPFVDVPAGEYRIKLHVKLEAGAGACPSAVAALKAAMTVTSDTGRRSLESRTPLQLSRDPSLACAVFLYGRFSTPEAAKQVETPLYLAAAEPLVVDGYALEAAASPPA